MSFIANRIDRIDVVQVSMCFNGTIINVKIIII